MSTSLSFVTHAMRNEYDGVLNPFDPTLWQMCFQMCFQMCSMDTLYKESVASLIGLYKNNGAVSYVGIQHRTVEPQF